MDIFPIVSCRYSSKCSAVCFVNAIKSRLYETTLQAAITAVQSGRVSLLDY